MDYIAISKVIPNSDNPRYIKEEKFKKLVQSLKDFPEMANARPIVVNTETSQEALSNYKNGLYSNK